MKSTSRLLALAAVPLLTLAACGDAETTAPAMEPGTIDPAVTVPSTEPTVATPGTGASETPQTVTVESLLENAASHLGTPEAGLDPTWRIGRRGDEAFALTEDYVVGRFTVELDDDGTSAFAVTGVTVELPGGAQTVTEETLLTDAAAVIGTAEDDLPDDARIARRGNEFLAVTEDYRIGRFTYDLDDDGTGTFRVVAVQIELPGGVETVTAQS